MAIVTLTTDWGVRDFYAGAMKGALLGFSETLTIVDISHLVQSFDLLNGAFIFRNAYSQFPNGTVHIIGIVTEAEHDSGLIGIRHHGQYFIGLNDGFFSLVFDEAPEEVIAIAPSREKHTAFDRTAVAHVAAELAGGRSLSELGVPLVNYVQKTHLRAVIDEDVIKGTVIYIDTFENVITNITKPLFERIGKDRRFEIIARRGEYNIDAISQRYSNVPRGQVLALFNTAGYLEIAINQGNAAGLLGISKGDIVRMEFY